MKGEPSRLYFRGHYLEARLKSERVTRGEVLAAIRASGHGALSGTDAVVLETDGSFSVIATLGDDERAMETVNGKKACGDLKPSRALPSGASGDYEVGMRTGPSLNLVPCTPCVAFSSHFESTQSRRDSPGSRSPEHHRRRLRFQAACNVPSSNDKST